MNILNTLRKDPKAKELMKSMPVPRNEEEVLAGYASKKISDNLCWSPEISCTCPVFYFTVYLTGSGSNSPAN